MNIIKPLTVLPFLLFLFGSCTATTIGADKTDAATKATNVFPNGLECPTLSMCSTYSADPSRVPFPADDTPGGTLLDGLYRPVQGTSLAYVLAISITEGKWARVMPNLSVQYGDITLTAENQYQTTRHTTCANGIIDDDAYVLEENYFFAADGDELITYGGCNSADRDQCNSPVRLVRVNELCDNLNNLVCEDGDCKCVEFSDTIPVRPEDDTCEF